MLLILSTHAASGYHQPPPPHASLRQTHPHPGPASPWRMTWHRRIVKATPANASVNTAAGHLPPVTSSCHLLLSPPVTSLLSPFPVTSSGQLLLSPPSCHLPPVTSLLSPPPVTSSCHLLLSPPVTSLLSSPPVTSYHRPPRSGCFTSPTPVRHLPDGLVVTMTAKLKEMIFRTLRSGGGGIFRTLGGEVIFRTLRRG
ncbi:unnamed protein product, partial [Gadus morhua 'NCC']